MRGPLPALRALAAARRRHVAIGLAYLAPWATLAGWVALRGGPVVVPAAIGVAVSLLALLLMRRLRRFDRTWLIRALDARAPALQDSSDLLFTAEAGLSPVERLQRHRVSQVLHAAVPQLQAPWPWPRLAANLAIAGVAAAVLAAALMLFTRPATGAPPTGEAPGRAAAVQSLQVAVEVKPPAYTGLAARRVETLDLRVEEGAQVAWSLRLAVPPRAARLRFVDGSALPLEAVRGGWRGTRTIERATLYRIELEGATLPASVAGAHRIEVVPDRPPQLVVAAPERTLTVLEQRTRFWSLAFEASDDYGLGPAELELTQAQGSGEQVAVSERRIALRGEGDARRKRYVHRVDLSALGFAAGDDLVARVRVRDNRAPLAQQARSASFILRWPPESGEEGSGVDGLVQKSMPAYFRSQRQIIIDTEALLAQRARLPADEFVSRSDAIGADQRLLRLRYGQFLGEEAEDAEHPEADEHAAQPGDDAASLIAGAGHLHDLSEAATLLDPQTRTLLREALRAMWQAEGALRTGQPAAALPHEHLALDRIKQVQQANRIYLARVGLELPALDPQRRLSGEAPPAATRVDPLLAPAGPTRPPDAAWRALQAQATVLPLDALVAWLQAQPADEGTLPLLAAVDAVRADAACRACRADLQQRLWPRLALPAAPPPRRARPDAGGRAYLEALAPGPQP